MDLANARRAFLSTFPAQYRDHIIAFARQMSRLDVDVLMLTARKAVCLFHCLEYLGLFYPGKKLVISERWMDHDQSWLAGKRVAIVDEVIVTGTSIYKLHRDLLDARAASVQVHCLFINGSYFVEDFFKNIDLSQGFIKLDGQEAQALSTAIVDAMYSIPRPYSVDYPMSTWAELPISQMPLLKALPGWQSLARHWMGSDRPKDRRRVLYFRITPREEMAAEIDSAIGANVSERCLMKIRLYGYLTGSGSARKYAFRIVPYVVLGELPLQDFERVFAQLISQLSFSDQQIAITSCVSEVSRLRVVQYVLSARLGHYWISQLAGQRVSIGFRQDSGELNFIFPSSVHELLGKLTREASQAPLRIYWPAERFAPSTNVPGDSGDVEGVPAYYRLVGPFTDMYKNKELPLRRLALELGEGIFDSPRYKELLDRLDKGISLDGLRDFASRKGISSQTSVLSDFLDLGIDSGVIVPITVSARIAGVRRLYRAYRHGEETYIVERDAAMFHAMLDKFGHDWQSGARPAEDEAEPQVPRLVVEKLLILFLRYAVGSDLLRTSHERLDADVRGMTLNVGYHRHGARLSTKRHDPTEFPQDGAFVDFLLSEKVLRRTRSGGYGIARFSRHGVLDAKRRAAAMKFGGVMAKALSLPPDRLVAGHESAEGGRTGAPSAIRDRVLVSLTTCETAVSTAIAVGAELRLFCEYFPRGFALPVGNTDGMLSKLQSVNARFFLNNAMAKVNAHLDRVASVAADQLGEALGRDTLEAAVWTEIWSDAVQHRSFDEEREANNLLLRCLKTAWRLDFNIQLLVVGLLTSKRMPTKAVRAKIDEMVQRVGRRGAELAGRTGPDGKSVKAMSAFSKMAFDLERRFSLALARWDRAKDETWATPRAISEELHAEWSEAASIFAQIDNQYRERSAIRDIERFDTSLFLRVSFRNESTPEDDRRRREGMERGLAREVQGYVARANGQSKPRTYRGAPGSVSVEDVIQVRTQRTAQAFEIQLFGRGSGVPAWFGYIVGRFLAYDDYSPIQARASWIAIVGLDETRQFSQAADADNIVGTPLIAQLVDSELAGSAQEGRLICAGRTEGRQSVMQAFQDEYSASRKSESALRTEDVNLGVEALGGTADIFTYGAAKGLLQTSEAQPCDRSPAALVMATEWSSHHGGLSTFNRMLCKSLSQVGVKVVCVVQEASLSDIEDALVNKVQLLPSPADPGAPSSSGLFRGFQLPLGFKPTIVIGHGRVTGSAAKAQVVDRFTSAQRIHFVHVAPGEIEWFKPGEDTTSRAEEREEIERVLAKAAHLVAAVGERLYLETESLLAGSDPALHMFEPGLMNESDAQPLQLNHCLLLGRAEDWQLKGLDIAAQAIGHVVRDGLLPGREVELIVRGAAEGTGDNLRRDLLKFCLEADVQIRVKEFRASDDTISRDLKRASVLLMPSRREGFGLVALEAISAGIPVLVSDKSGVAAMLRKHVPEAAEAAIVTTVDDVEKSSISWAHAIASILADKEAAFARARVLKEKLRKKASWPNSAQKLLDAILDSTRPDLREARPPSKTAG